MKKKSSREFKTILITDSREQKPLRFKKSSFDELRVEGVPFGDYWLWFEDGKANQHVVPIVFERKSLGDLFGTMTGGYARFKREYQRAKENGFKLVLLIEGSMRSIHEGYKYSTFTGEAMLKKLAMLYVRYGIEYHFFTDRTEMARYITDIYQAVVRNFDVGGVEMVSDHE